ncbi:MAG: hypothetical protein FD130_519, partial [Halothiobacillaceae bacterium]
PADSTGGNGIEGTDGVSALSQRARSGENQGSTDTRLHMFGRIKLDELIQLIFATVEAGSVMALFIEFNKLLRPAHLIPCFLAKIAASRSALLGRLALLQAVMNLLKTSLSMVMFSY